MIVKNNDFVDLYNQSGKLVKVSGVEIPHKEKLMSVGVPIDWFNENKEELKSKGIKVIMLSSIQ